MHDRNTRWPHRTNAPTRPRATPQVHSLRAEKKKLEAMTAELARAREELRAELTQQLGEREVHPPPPPPPPLSFCSPCASPFRTNALQHPLKVLEE